MGERLYEELEVAELYQKHRLGYNDIGLEKKLLSFMSQSLKQLPYSCAVDVGCGTGLLTRILAPHFTRVIGVDISEAQIQVARRATKDANVKYKIATAEDMSFLTDNSAELVVAAVSVHFFDTESFFKEVDRILVPGGCLAIIQPKSFHLTPDTDNADVIEKFTLLFNEFRSFYRRVLSQEASNILNGDLYEPYRKSHRFILTTERSGNIDIFSEFASTLGGMKRFCRENAGGGDVTESFKRRFLKILNEISTSPEKVKVTLSCPLLCCLYRKPSI